MFYPQKNGQTKRQNNTIEAYLQAFVNWEQNNWIKFLPIVKFVYNNVKNASIGHNFLKFNYRFYPYIFF